MPTDNTPADTFITEEGFNSWFATELSVYHCVFNKERYRDELFNNFDIPFPQSLQNSVIKRRAEFLAGRHCARNALEKMGISNATLGIGEHRNPLWPQNTIGSISHCGTQAVAIAGDLEKKRGVGIDIEDVVSEETAKNIQRQIVFSDEIALISELPEKMPLLFTIVFSVKESFFKAAYPTVKRYFGFDAVSVSAIDEQEGSISLIVNDTLDVTFPRGLVLGARFKILPEKKVVTLIEVDRH